MSEFRLATLVVMALLLIGVAAYSYWQIQHTRTRYEEKFGRKPPSKKAGEKKFTKFTYSAKKSAPSNKRPSASQSTVREQHAAFKTDATVMQPIAVSVDETTAPTSAVAVGTPLTSLNEDEAYQERPLTASPPIEAYLHEAEHARVTVPNFDYSESDAMNEIAQRVSQQELNERATWAVFAPLTRLEAWFANAYPYGTPVVNGIDAQVFIQMAQPKTAEDIERALFDLRLPTELPLRLQGVRSGQVGLADLDGASTKLADKDWQDLSAGTAYNALKFTLQLANKTHCADEELLNHWLTVAERLRKRLAGTLHELPNAPELAASARYLHGLVRRMAQPWVVQLHKKNGLWQAMEIYQQLTSCGAKLNEHGVFVVYEEIGQPQVLYTMVNDINNPRAQDFTREQMNVMYVHTLSFYVEVAAQSDASSALARMLDDMSVLAQTLEAQWHNNVGELILAEPLKILAQEQVHAFAARMNALGLPIGSMMVKRLLS